MTQKNKEGSLECRFDPPLWIQRRAFTANFILKNAVKSVFDFGCGDGSLIQVLINSCQILKIAGVDLDPGEVHAAVDNCSPKARDFEEQRELPLNLQFFQGSIDSVDDRCRGWDAITMIEV
jgi:methylase of polypeptide subunit release factors